MTSLVRTVDGWVGTARSVRWSPMLAAPVASVAALVALRLAADAEQAVYALVGQSALAFTAAAAGFVVDDGAAEAAPGAPTEAAVRLGVRAAVALPVLVAGWAAVLGVHVALVEGPVEPGTIALTSLAIAAVALGVAGVTAGASQVGSPGVAGLAAIAVLAAAQCAVPPAWLEAAPPTRVTAGTTVVLGALALVITTRRRRT